MTYTVAARSDPEIEALPDRHRRTTVALLDLCQMHVTEFVDSSE